MSLIQPYLNYCNIIWGAADKTILEPLFILQKKAIRIVNRVHYLEHSKPLFESMKTVTIYQLPLILAMSAQFEAQKNSPKPCMRQQIE